MMWLCIIDHQTRIATDSELNHAASTYTMPRITVTISDELDDYLEEHSGDGEEFDSKSEVMRHLAQRGQETDDLETELEMKQNRIKDLERQMGARDQVEEKVDVLANRIEQEQSNPDPPFFVRWAQWWRSRGESDDEKDG